MPAMPTFPKNRCLLYFCNFPMWNPGSGVILDFLAHLSLKTSCSIGKTQSGISFSHIGYQRTRDRVIPM